MNSLKFAVFWLLFPQGIDSTCSFIRNIIDPTMNGVSEMSDLGAVVTQEEHSVNGNGALDSTPGGGGGEGGATRDGGEEDSSGNEQQVPYSTPYYYGVLYLYTSSKVDGYNKDVLYQS